MSLSEDERTELEWLRKHYRQNMMRNRNKSVLGEALFIRGLFSGLAANWIVPYFTPDTPFGRGVSMASALVCMTLGILSSYYGPFKKKKAVEG